MIKRNRIKRRHKKKKKDCPTYLTSKPPILLAAGDGQLIRQWPGFIPRYFPVLDLELLQGGVTGHHPGDVVTVGETPLRVTPEHGRVGFT